MGRLNWSGFDGAEFESLVHSLLFFEEPDVILFGRPGKDNGQDAISGDKTHVYQAKYGSALGIKDAVARSKIELDNIRKKLCPDNEDYKYWSNVKHWTLVANFAKNPSDQAKWESEIVSAYSDLHIDLDYWDAAQLESLLLKYPDVEQAYFSGRNRSFVGLWEARRFVEKGIYGEYFFGTKAFSWEEHFAKVDEFAASPAKRFMFVYGKAEIGKTRFLYESASRMSANGWRVFWGLADSMSCSDAWMTGITGANKKICLIVDAPKSSRLVNSIYEQLGTIDKCSWKVIVSCQQYEFNDWFRGNSLRSDTDCIELTALSEKSTKDFVAEFAHSFELTLPNRASEGLFTLTRGVPGWIVLILGHSHKNQVPLSLDFHLLDAVSEEVRKAMDVWDSTSRERRLNVLRWVCAWKTIAVENGTENEDPIIAFLGEELKIQPELIYDDLKSLVEKGLLVCWGRNRRIYTVEPMLVRQHVLCEWLLERDDSTYRVTKAGHSFIRKLLNSEIPKKDSIVDNLAELTSSYLRAEKAADFFKPIIDMLKNDAGTGDTEQQLAVFDWAKRVARVDPESALDIVRIIWDNPKPSKIVSYKYWGNHTFEHSQVLSEIPDFLLALSEGRQSKPLSRAIWDSFRRIFEEEKAGKFKASRGQKAEDIILKLLQRIRSNPFQGFAFEDLDQDCKNGTFSKFDIMLAKGLLSCRREGIEAFRREVVFSHAYIKPDTIEWSRAIDTRALMYDLLEHNMFPAYAADIWSVLAETHNGWRTSDMLDADCAQKLSPHYAPIVLDDLKRTCCILKSKGHTITKVELETARDLWSRALEYWESNEEKSLAAACEEEYAKHYSWNYSDFFSWDIDKDDLERTLRKIKEYFVSAITAQDVASFFEEADGYLVSKDPDRRNDDCGRGYDLAANCYDIYMPGGEDAFSKFAEESLRLPTGDNCFRDVFLVQFLRIRIRTFKKTNPAKNIVDEIKRLVGISKGKEQLLAAVYAGVSNKVLGKVSCEELLFVCSKECAFDCKQLARILPSFLGADKEKVLKQFESILDDALTNKKEMEYIWWCFVQNSYLVTLRTEEDSFPSPIEWLLEAFCKYEITGECLSWSAFQYLAEHIGYKLSQRGFVNLIKNRLSIDQSPRPYSDFSVMPHKFDIASWVSMEKDEAAIHDLCKLSVETKTYLAIYKLPDYIAALDVDGSCVESFVTHYLSSKVDKTPIKLEGLGGLVSCYSQASVARGRIIECICHYMNANGFNRDDRYAVYQSFQKKSQTWSSNWGEVPKLFIDTEAATRKALEVASQNSDAYEYLVWAHNRADWDLKSAQERAEEERHD